MMATDYTQLSVIIGLIFLIHVVAFAIVMIVRAIRRHNSHLEAQRRYHEWWDYDFRTVRRKRKRDESWGSIHHNGQLIHGDIGIEWLPVSDDMQHDYKTQLEALRRKYDRIIEALYVEQREAIHDLQEKHIDTLEAAHKNTKLADKREHDEYFTE
jgi:hypothetical protein